MHLYLMRHGQAKAAEEDPERGLTVQGWYDTRKIAGWLAGKHLHISCIYHSTKLRAQQTAILVADTIGATRALSSHENLSPNDPVGPWKTLLENETRTVMVVGHLPFLGKLVSLLVDGSEESDTVQFPSSGIVCLSRIDAVWNIEWETGPGQV
ncbi:MAG: phosphohistidine phosphatase SixA [Spirochaetales bacterium]|nr:phosphohistidine phosphatase SixA [Spirochaetales bacterium]